MAPKFPKPKDEGWFLILGDVENRELLALKRVPFIGARANQTLAFQTPEEVRERPIRTRASQTPEEVKF